MASQIARIGDQVSATCSAHGGQTGTITTGSGLATCNGIGVARTNDTGVLTCGHTFKIIGGSAIGDVNGVRIARVGDLIQVTGGASGTGVITTGSPTSDMA